MNTKIKKIAIAGISALFAATLFTGISTIKNHPMTVNADTGANATSSEYFYDNLTITAKNGKTEEYTLAKKFYKALDGMYKNGDFEDGKIDYSLTDNNLATSAEIQAWVKDGDLTIPKAFSAARDAYLTDHPEIFYVDFYKMNLSAGYMDDAYVAFIDCGRESDIFFDGFTSQNLKSKIAAFDSKVDDIVARANKAAEDDKSNAADDLVKAKFVNTYLAENIVYSYSMSDNAMTDELVHSAYGGLVDQRSVCDGFSTSYKVIMDKLEIPCLVIKGFSQSKDERGFSKNTSVGHAWNYVWLADPDNGAAHEEGSGKWYAFDVTWNGGDGIADRNTYSVMNATTMLKDRITDSVISSSGYALKYPEVSLDNYGGVSTSGGISCRSEYEIYGDGSKDDFGFDLYYSLDYVSYNGKSAASLYEDDGINLAVRYGYYNEGVLTWTDWWHIYNSKKFMDLISGEDAWASDNGTETIIYGNTDHLYSQYAIIDCKPNDSREINGETFDMFYTPECKPEEHLTAITDVLVNEAYGTYAGTPTVTQSIPLASEKVYISDNMGGATQGVMDEKYAITHRVTYSNRLHKIDESQPIGVLIKCSETGAEEYMRLLPFEDGTTVHLEYNNTLVFKFSPSLMYQHDSAYYTFTFTNVCSAETVKNPTTGEIKTSDKVPASILYSYGRKIVVCPKVFNDGRYWVDCMAKPTLLSNSKSAGLDLLDPDGGAFSESQRSQMVLVVDNNVDKAVKDEMLDKAGDNVMASEVYDINFQICSQIPKFQDGSYVKISLGFPAGYGPDDEGVTFKILHRKHEGNGVYVVEELPCVITRYGLVVTCTSFSPYMVVAVPAGEVTQKTVIASVEGNGGTLSKEDGDIKVVKQGESCVYTISNESGYQLYSITLNGKDVKDKVASGKLTLGYDELSASNEIEIKFISDAAAERYAAKSGFELVEPVKVYVPEGTLYPSYEDISSSPAKSNNNVGVIVGVIVAVIAVAAVGAIAFVLIKRKNDGQKVKAKSGNAKKSAQKAKEPKAAAPKAAAPEKAPAKPATPKTTAAPAKPAASKPSLPTTQPKPAATKPSLPTAQPKPAASKPSLPKAEPKTAAKPSTTAKPSATTKPVTKPTNKK